MTTPTVRTSRLLLRPFERGDAARVFEMSRERGVREWIPDQVYRDEAQARRVVEHLAASAARGVRPDEDPFVLGICLWETGELVGHVGLSPMEGTAEVGYAVAESHQGKGYATEAVAAMTAWGLERFGLGSVLGIVSADNTASCRVLERAGYALVRVREGVLHGRQGLVRTYSQGLTGEAVNGRASGARSEG